jgi:hypothetical protein
MEKKVIPEEWGHPIIVRGEVEVRKIGGKKVVFPIRSFSRWAHRALMNYVLPNYASGITKAPITFTHLPITNLNGESKGWGEGETSPPVSCFHFCGKLRVGASDAPWNYNQYNLQDPKDEASAYTRRLDTTEEDSTIKAEFQGLVQASDTYDIKETGLIGVFYPTTGPADYYLVSRDVLPAPIPVQPFDVVVVYYRFTVGGG